MAVRVLVADDSNTMRKIILRSLYAVGVPSAVEASDGNEAVQIFIPGHFDLVLTDWNMPGKTGLEVIKEIRAKDANVPIIMITTEAEKSRVVQALQAGASDYLVKPFTPETLPHETRKARLRHGGGKQTVECFATAPLVRCGCVNEFLRADSPRERDPRDCGTP